MANETEQQLESHDEQALRQLRAEFPGHRIWRGVDHRGRAGDWVATLRDPAAGVYPTVICSTPTALRESLEEEAKRAREQARPEWIAHVLREVGA
jgi:hypothetical protein